MRISDWSSDVCSSDLVGDPGELRFPARLLAIAQRRKGEVARRLGELDILILARVTPAGGQGQTVGQVALHMRESGEGLFVQARRAGDIALLPRLDPEGGGGGRLQDCQYVRSPRQTITDESRRRE